MLQLLTIPIPALLLKLSLPILRPLLLQACPILIGPLTPLLLALLYAMLGFLFDRLKTVGVRGVCACVCVCVCVFQLLVLLYAMLVLSL